MSVIVTKSTEETQKIAFELAKDILNKPHEEGSALVLALDGVLGAGKTTFTQGFADGLSITEVVTSPTFLILKEYNIVQSLKSKVKSNDKTFTKFYHIDCYRLKDENDIEDIGLHEVLKNPENIVLIEWAGNIKKSLPKEYIKIKFYYISENKRKISIM